MPSRIELTINGYRKDPESVSRNKFRLFAMTRFETPETVAEVPEAEVEVPATEIEVPVKRLLVIRCTWDDQATIVRQSDPIQDFPAPEFIEAYATDSYEDMDRIAVLHESDEPFPIPEFRDQRDWLVNLAISHEVFIKP